MRTVLPAPWRILFVSQALPAVQGFDAFARALGHLPVGLITSSGPAGRGEQRSAGGNEFFNRLVNEAPPDLDIVIPHDRSRLMPVIAQFEPDLILCAGFPWRLPPEVLSLPPLGAVNAHPSLLPKYRGPMPFAWAFRNGDREMGMTYHRMDADFDTGAILAQGSVPIEEDDALEDLIPKLAALSAELLPRVFDRVAAGDPGDPQDETAASYAGRFEEEYATIDWSRPAAVIHDQVRAWRATFGDPRGAFAELDGTTVRVLRSRPDEAAEGAPGSVVRRHDDAVLVRCGEGGLWILESEPT